MSPPPHVFTMLVLIKRQGGKKAFREPHLVFPNEARASGNLGGQSKAQSRSWRHGEKNVSFRVTSDSGMDPLKLTGGGWGVGYWGNKLLGGQ